MVTNGDTRWDLLDRLAARVHMAQLLKGLYNLHCQLPVAVAVSCRSCP